MTQRARRRRKRLANQDNKAAVNKFTRGLIPPEDLLLIVAPDDRVSNSVVRFGLTYQLVSAIVRGYNHVAAKYQRTHTK